MEETQLSGVGKTGKSEDVQQRDDETLDGGGAKAESFAPPHRGIKRPVTALTPDPRSPLLPRMEGLWHLTLGWQPNEQQQTQFQQLYALTLAGNRQFNLTRITEPTEFWEKHLWDSLRGVQRFLRRSGDQEPEARSQETKGSEQKDCLTQIFKVIDIGTGAGFPGLPVAIAQPNWTVTLLDATRKKITFLDQVLASMGLSNATTLVDRVEQVGRQKYHRQGYDLALIRAVAAAPICAEYALPLLKIGGYAVLYRGQWTDAETVSLEAAIASLGGEIDRIDAFTTPLTQGDRHCIYVKKIASTPNEFPRAIGVPTQKPLGWQATPKGA